MIATLLLVLAYIMIILTKPGMHIIEPELVALDQVHAADIGRFPDEAADYGAGK